MGEGQAPGRKVAPTPQRCLSWSWGTRSRLRAHPGEHGDDQPSTWHQEGPGLMKALTGKPWSGTMGSATHVLLSRKNIILREQPETIMYHLVHSFSVTA